MLALMGTQTVIAPFLGGRTNHAFRLRNRLTGTIIDTQDCAETAVDSAVYTAVFTDQPAGLYLLQFVRKSDWLVVGDDLLRVEFPTDIYPANNLLDDWASGQRLDDVLERTSDRAGLILAVAAGVVPDQQTLTPEYIITHAGQTFTVTFSGVTETGVRAGVVMVVA